MKIRILGMLLVLLVSSSCGDKTDASLLEKDKKTLTESLDTYKVSVYKFGKIAVRASVEEDPVSPEFKAIKSKMNKVYTAIMHYNTQESLSVLEYIGMYRDYKEMSSFIQKTDEDIFPTLSEAIAIAYGDAKAAQKPRLKGAEKIYLQNLEHAFLSALVIASRSFGKELSLYECSKTYPEFLPDTEIKPLLRYFRGFLFFEKGLLYLSEDEISKNITWLNEHPEVDLPLVRKMFQWDTFNKEKTHIGFHGVNHLFRGLNRLMMEREIDEQRALDDFEVFIKDTKKLGQENEAIWAIETFLYLKKEENEKAITSLTKLKTSPLLSVDEKKGIDESIVYLKDRQPDKVLNGMYDKYFLSKIATKYMLSVLAKVDWKKLLKDQDVPYTDEIFKTIASFKIFLENMDKYASGDGIKETGKELKYEGSKLWEKAKNAVSKDD